MWRLPKATTLRRPPTPCCCWEPPDALGGLLWAEGCAEGVYSSPAEGGAPEGVCRKGVSEGCRCVKPPHALGGLCWRRGAPEGCAIALPRGRAEGRRRGVAVGSHCIPWEASYVGGGVCHSLAEGCAGGRVTEGVCRRGAPVGNGRMPWEASHVGGGVHQGCAIAMPRRRAGGGAGGVPLFGAAACPARPPMWPEGCAIALPRGCTRGWCRCWESPHALGGLLCGSRRGVP